MALFDKWGLPELPWDHDMSDEVRGIYGVAARAILQGVEQYEDYKVYQSARGLRRTLTSGRACSSPSGGPAAAGARTWPTCFGSTLASTCSSARRTGRTRHAPWT